MTVRIGGPVRNPESGDCLERIRTLRYGVGYDSCPKSWTGWLQATCAIMRVLAEPVEPMRVRDIHAEAEELVGQGVAVGREELAGRPRARRSTADRHEARLRVAPRRPAREQRQTRRARRCLSLPAMDMRTLRHATLHPALRSSSVRAWSGLAPSWRG